MEQLGPWKPFERSSGLSGLFFAVFAAVGCVLLIYFAFVNFDCYFVVSVLFCCLLSFAERCWALLLFLLGFVGLC